MCWCVWRTFRMWFLTVWICEDAASGKWTRRQDTEPGVAQRAGGVKRSVSEQPRLCRDSVSTSKTKQLRKGRSQWRLSLAHEKTKPGCSRMAARWKRTSRQQIMLLGVAQFFVPDFCREPIPLASSPALSPYYLFVNYLLDWQVQITESTEGVFSQALKFLQGNYRQA